MPKKRPGRAQWFKIHLNDKALIDAIPSENVGDALKAGMAYFADGKTTKMEPMTQALFSVIKSAIDGANEAYSKAVKDGSKGGRPSVREGNPPLPTLTEGVPTLTEKDIRIYTANGLKANSPGMCDHDTSWMEGLKE